MRLTAYQISITKKTVDEIIGVPNQVWLFGSRVDDDLKGGDIDLFVETQASLDNKAISLCRLYAALIMALGDRKLDIVLKDGRTETAPIFEIAKRSGILL